jgi:predicted NAD/FAD-binding protein
MGYGFHEDGLVSALHVAQQLDTAAPWKALADAA